MSQLRSVAARPRFFTVEEANRALPLVRAIAGDIARQTQTVIELRERLAALHRDQHRRPSADPYSEELVQFQQELEAEESKLQVYLDELEGLGVVPNGPLEGLCDFPSLRDGREVYLCWKLGEPEVLHWHEKSAGFAGRQPLNAPRTGPRSR